MKIILTESQLKKITKLTIKNFVDTPKQSENKKK